MLELLDIEGCIITIDAIGTQTKIMDQIISKKANFVLPLKENQKGAYAEVKDFFDDILENSDLKNLMKSKLMVELKKLSNNIDVYITREKKHGRKEERIYIKIDNVGWFKSRKWRHIQCLVMVIYNTTVHDGGIRYYVSSVDLPVEELAKVIRKHWQIENNLHWVLDMYFYEDLSRTRKDYAMENLSLLTKMCYNIIKLDTRYDKINKNGNLIKMSTKRKINRYNLYPSEFEQLLFEIMPQWRQRDDGQSTEGNLFQTIF